MKTIKIIDLLNKIAKGEEAPQKIRIGALYMYWDGSAYWDEDGETSFCEVIGSSEYGLNRKVEIIEEDKEIEKIKSNGIEFYSDYINVWIKKEETVAYCEYLMNKVNELIDAVNELKRGN